MHTEDKFVLQLTNMNVIVGTRCYLLITSELILMSKDPAESIDDNKVQDDSATKDEDLDGRSILHAISRH